MLLVAKHDWYLLWHFRRAAWSQAAYPLAVVVGIACLFDDCPTALIGAVLTQWVEDLIKQSEERQAASLDATLEAKLDEIIDDTIDEKIDLAVATSVQAAGEDRTVAEQVLLQNLTRSERCVPPSMETSCIATVLQTMSH